MTLYEVAPVCQFLDVLMEVGFPNILVSYFYAKSTKLESHMENMDGRNFLLDSGAHSAHTCGAKIDIGEYMEFIHKYKDKITIYANLDDIEDYKKTIENQRIMESNGLTPMQSFHYGEPLELLRDYLQQYQYIGIGGVVGKSKAEKIRWLDTLYANVLRHFPDRRVHMWGVHDKDILLRYPFCSADASSSSLQAAIGGYCLGGKAVNWKKLPRTVQSMNHLCNEKNPDMTKTQISKGRFLSFLQQKLRLQHHVTQVWQRRGIVWH